jgi:DNA-directed RNA polymerase subunit RPC12/RpoP
MAASAMHQHQNRCSSSPSALLLEWMAHIKMSLDDVCETSPRMWKTLNPMADCYQAPMATQHAACRLSPDPRVSLATPAVDGKECSDGGSGCLIASDDSGRMQVRCGECGQRVLVVVVMPGPASQSSSSCPETLIVGCVWR